MTGILFSQSKVESKVLDILSKKQIAFSYISIEDGLSQNSAFSIAQDMGFKQINNKLHI